MLDAYREETINWLPLAKPLRQSAVNLFCFPYSGANASIYHSWLSGLPKPLAVIPVELPGRGRRLSEPPHTRLSSLVESAAEALIPYLDHPFAFFGHSMGALLSFELARFLRDCCGRSPVHLFLSGSGAPHLPHPEQPISELPEPEFIQRLRELNGTEEAILACPELRELLLPILRADFAICETYRYLPGEPLDCPISVFGGLSDPFVGRADLEPWKVHTRAAFRVRLFPGDHFFLHTNGAQILTVFARELYRIV